MKKNIAIFASGAGSNAINIYNFSINNNSCYKVALIVCNNPKALIINKAKELKIPVLLIEKEEWNSDLKALIDQLFNFKIDAIVLSGFLLKIPLSLIKLFPNKIVNIHPALLPNYGGTGMYGKHVHEAVIKNGEKESGITIHFVDEIYDHGEIIFQSKCTITKNDTIEILIQKIHELEMKYFPVVINDCLF